MHKSFFLTFSAFIFLIGFFVSGDFAHAVSSNSTVSLEVTASAVPDATPAPAVTTVGSNGPPVAQEPEASQAFAPLQIVSVVSNPGLTSARITWKTNHPARATLTWGKTPLDKMGSFTLSDFALSHTADIPNLQSGTQYFFSIEATDVQEKNAVRTGEQFTTQSVAKETFSANVNNLSVVERGSGAELSWENPEDEFFESVRIVRSTLFFPRDPLDGKIIYEGSGEVVQDDDISPDQNYFYSVFAKTKDGRYSSGAVARFSVGSRPGPGTVPTRDPLLTSTTTSLDLLDFYITQSPIKDSRFVVTTGAPVLVSLPKTRIPSSVKTIILTFPDWQGTDAELSYMLRLNEAKNAYEAVLPAFKESGEFSFFFEVFGIKNEPVKIIPGTFVVVENAAQKDGTFGENSSAIVGFSLFIFLSLFLAIFLRKLYTVFLG